MGDVLENDSLAGARLSHDQPALAFAQGRHDVDDAAGEILGYWLLDLHLQPLVWIERRQIVEMDLVALLLGVVEIDSVHFEEREIALALFRASDLAFDRVAGAQPEAADLRRRDVDVVGAGEIIRVGRAQKAEAVLQHLDHAGPGDVDITGGQLLQNREHELLLAHGARVLDGDLLGEAQELRRRFGLKVLQFHFLHALLLQTGMVEFLKVSTRVFACGSFAEGGFASGVRHDYERAPRRVTQFFKDFSGRDSVPGSDATHLIADQTGGRNSLAVPGQNGRTITKITMPIMSSVGTSFIMR